MVSTDFEHIHSQIHLSIQQQIFEGESCVNIQEKAHSYLLQYFLNPTSCVFDLNGAYYSITIELEKHYLERYKTSTLLVTRQESICCNVQGKLLDMIHCDLKGIEREIFLESQILYLIHYLFKNNHFYESHCGCTQCGLSQKTTETTKVKHAHQYIQEHLHEKLTIPEIAQTVGTNQCYLKKGFKELYGCTIFDFVLENRMLKAEHFLKNSDKKLIEIAELVGYSSLSSFSKAYKNYFGISPSLVEH
jgi:AraC-like DNA-binding protein